MEMISPLFSIAIVTFQQRHLLEDCLYSIFKQTYPNIELIICDDESCDFNVADVNNFIRKHKSENIKNVIVYKQKRNVGTTANCQKAYELANGEFFKLQAGDDMLMDKRVLEKIAKYFETSSVNIIATIAQACTHDGRLVPDFYPPIPNFVKAREATPKQLFKYIGTEPWGAYVCAPAVFWRKGFLSETGGFDLSYKFTEDWPMWLRICQQDIPIKYIDEVTTIYRYGGISNDQSESNKTLGRAHYNECIRLLKEIAMPQFTKEGSWFPRIRCWHSIKSIEARIVKEMEWDNFGLWEKLSWKLQSFPFLMCSEIFHVRNTGINMPIRPSLFCSLICMIFFYFNIGLYPTWPAKYIWSVFFILNIAYICCFFVCKVFSLLLTSLLNLRIMIHKN